MPLIGHSDEDLRKREAALRDASTELEKQKSDLASQKTLLDHEKEVFKAQKTSFEAEREQMEKDREILEARRQEVLRLETAAKANFTETQRKTFEEVIQSRLDACAAREEKLAEYQSSLAEREAAVMKREGEVSQRELDVTGREQSVEAGLPDKIRVLAEETRRKELAMGEEKERLKILAEELSNRSRALDVRDAEIAGREEAVRDAESKRDAGFSGERMAFQSQLETLRQEARIKEESDISTLRAKLHAQLDEDIATERASRLKALEEELAERRRVVDEREKKLDMRDESLKEAESRIAEDRRAIDAEKDSIERDRKRMERDEARRRGNYEDKVANLDTEIETRLSELCAGERAERDVLRQSNNDLKQKLHEVGLAYERFDAFKCQFGERSPEQVIADLEAKTLELNSVREALAARPTREAFDDLSEKYRLLQAASKARESAWEESETLKRDISRLEAEKSFVESECAKMEERAKSSDALAEKYRTDLERLTVSYAKETERDERIAAIRQPVITAGNIPSISEEEIPSEVDWLNGIGKACEEYGIRFPGRILYAYHTALKTAEISPLVVLAGVSGTGKSELPRLYSHFGGLFFEPVSVQPNWDCQESMLGFFNSIDNRFDAQRLLRFLAQSQSEWSDDYPGLKERMCMVLLDEMNLAHPELYFAEFLSKFETRRGRGPDDIPAIEIKLGSGIPPYQLPLGRNILWSGTMNQDETTKSLSDKVLDRAIVINFPRPDNLIPRPKLKRLEDVHVSATITWKTWKSWLHKGESAFLNREDLIRPYRLFLEQINKFLGVAGRAIGHRVWQSVEAYMSSYPGMFEALAKGKKDDVLVQELMHTAFEDQLVQKVMPKLRGIDTRGETREKCLDKIRSELQEGVGGMPFNLDEDFELACKLGYGQFVWQSANYIEGNSRESSGSMDAKSAIVEISGGEETDVQEPLKKHKSSKVPTKHPQGKDDK